MNDTVSVIVTSYRRPHLLQDALRSVVNQTWKDREIIVVDDNSRMTEIKDVLREFSSSIRAIVTDVSDEDRPKKCRYAECINIGIAASSGRYLTYLTDDDIYYPSRLEKMVTWFQSHPAPEFMICYGSQSIVQIQGNGHHHLFAIRRTVGITNRPHGQIDHCSFMHRRECLDKLTEPFWPTDPSCWGGGDMAFFDRLIPYWHFYPVDEILDEKRHHANSIQARMNAGMSPVYG